MNNLIIAKCQVYWCFRTFSDIAFENESERVLQILLGNASRWFSIFPCTIRKAKIQYNPEGYRLLDKMGREYRLSCHITFHMEALQ